MPANTVSVTRPGPWGNPYGLGDGITVGGFRDGKQWSRPAEAADLVRFFEAYLARNPELVARARLALTGKNLACYCPLGSPCHRNVWGRLLNKDWTEQ